jgi:hypothetical protein
MINLKTAFNEESLLSGYSCGFCKRGGLRT